MADDTFASRDIRTVLVKGDKRKLIQVLANGVDIKPGSAVTFKGETAGTDYVDLATLAEPIDGIIVAFVININAVGAPRALDAASIASEAMWMAPRTGGELEVWTKVFASTDTFKRGQLLQASAEAGKVAIATAGTDYSVAPVTAAEDYTEDTTDDTLIKVKI